MSRLPMRLPFLLLLAAAALPAAPDGSDLFENRVRPLLAAKCFACHTDAKMGGLRLDSRDAMLAGGGRGPAIAPGEPDQSLLLRAVRRESKDLAMPPTEPLPAEAVAALEAWIAAGAVWPEAAQVSQAPPGKIAPEARRFWSFQPIGDPAPPPVKDQAAAPTTLDRFLQARIEADGLALAPAADRRTLIRRATLDLHGLPPTPEEVEAFVADQSPDAWEKVVDRLLASPRYGERWARFWFDLARYGDGQSAAQTDTPLANAWRYRDWVIQAFNQDMPYDVFVKAQLAADLLQGEDCDRLLPGLGFHALRDRDDDRVDVTSRVFLGLTVGCAQCHDHKFDPIPQSDFYSLQGIFDSSTPREIPLAPDAQVRRYKAAQKLVSHKKRTLDDYLESQSDQLIDAMMERTDAYLQAAWQAERGGASVAEAAEAWSVDSETLERWIAYLNSPELEHPYLDEWRALWAADRAEPEQVRAAAESFEKTLLAIHEEKRAIDDRNYVKLGGKDGVKDQKTLLNTNLEFIEPVKWYLWRDLAAGAFRKDGYPFDGGLYYYSGAKLDRFLSGVFLERAEQLRAELADLEKASPKPYPFLHAYTDAAKPKDIHIAIRGDKQNPGAVAPRRFLAILSDDEPENFTHGSGRLELAQAIASPQNPLTARVMVNRIWQRRFGRGIVNSPSNFGQLGERPTHPLLLDWLASRFVESGWSVKQMDRLILLSAAYRRSSERVAANDEKDPENLRLWRMNLVERMEAEVLRDSLLAVSGKLDLDAGGPGKAMTDDFAGRAVYGKISRTTPDRTLTLFDFPDPKSHSEERSVTVGPLQRLWFMNSPFVMEQARALSERVAAEAGDDPDARVRRAYALAYGRPPSEAELGLARDFLATADWPEYAQMLLAAGEFFTVR
ncbi:MAG: DUF1553 domain-containing protein [Acidobacteria bacterium]|nr:DUF1553 domain-containing protein [Acidobacteriota bacterium]